MNLSVIFPECSDDLVSAGLRHLTAACVATIPELDGGYGLGGENGYGVDYENDTFIMRKQWWGDCTCGADDEDRDHADGCALVLPNFVHKPTGFTVEWYKYIGRGMEIDANGADFLGVLNDCLSSLPAGRQALAPAEVCGLVERLRGIDEEAMYERPATTRATIERSASTLEAQAAELAAVKAYSIEMLHRKDEQFERAERAETQLAEARKALEQAEQQLDYGQVDAAHRIIIRAAHRALTGGVR